jgi:nicotinamidase-related amidase
LVDLQNDFVDKEGKLFVFNTAEFLPKLPTMISLFRTKGYVFFIKTEYACPRTIYSDTTGGYGLVLKDNVVSKQASVHVDEAPVKIEHHVQTPPSEASMFTGGKLASDVEAFLTPPYNTRASWSQCCLPGSSGSSWPDVLSSSIEQTRIYKSLSLITRHSTMRPSFYAYGSGLSPSYTSVDRYQTSPSTPLLLVRSRTAWVSRSLKTV